MTVTPYRANLFQDHKDLHQFLLACRQTSLEKDCSQTISISLEIEPVDPLTVLHAIKQPDQLHFYFEKGCQGKTFPWGNGRSVSNQSAAMCFATRQAVAAIDAAVHLKVDGSERFSIAKDFIHSCLENTISVGALHLPFAGPHFFCSFAFFDETNGDPFPAATIFLPRWQVVRQNNHCVVVANLAISATSNLEILARRTWQNLQEINLSQGASLNSPDHCRGSFSKRNVASTDSFKAAALSILESIRAGSFNKTVLAHAIDVCSPVPLHSFHSLDNLRHLYPDCYVFSVGNGKGQSFIGASPERLIRVQDHELTTDALAGSAPRGKTALEDAYLANRLLCSEKEIREHQIVIDFIRQHLSQLGLRPRITPLPNLLQLSNIQHLQTPIYAKVPNDVHLLEILAELHPTPAVAGAPRDIACQQIRRYETFERSLYAAPLGWVDYQGNGEFAVGIRSALIDGCHARLYAGAGMVAGSDPDKELAEINLKLQALLEALV
jgi:menaquinone-specific isochorismate synthase